MGGRGGSSGIGKKRSNSSKKSSIALILDAPTIEIKSYYRKGHYGDTVKVSKETSDGNLVFENAIAEFSRDNKPSATTKDVTFTLRHGFVWHNNDKRFYGINWDNVKSVSGNTYDMNDELKKRGYRWNSNTKSWVKG